MKSFIKKIKKERWYLHAAISACIALIANIFLKSAYSPLGMALGAAFSLFMVGFFWELYWSKKTKSKFDITDMLANAVGAFIVTLIYQYVKLWLIN